MNKTRWTTTLISALLLLASPSANARKWTLQECIDYALAHNIQLRRNLLSRQSAHEDVLQSKAELLPSLTASTSQNVSYNPFRKIGRRWRVTLDDEVVEDEFALVSMCNGRYYGGGSTPVPEARMTDGVLHTILVKNVSKARFATLFPDYSAGNYKKLPQDIIRVSTAKLVRIEALEDDLTTCLDGESMHSQCVTLKLADKKVNFFAPKGCDPDATAR